MTQNNCSNRINVRGVYFDNVNKAEAFEKACSLINSDAFSYMVTPNSEIVQACIEHPELYPVINSADLVIPDGIGVVYASKILKEPLKEKVAGVEMAEMIVKFAAENGKRMYFFGGAKGTGDTKPVWQLAADNLKTKYPNIEISGRDGYFSDEELYDIIDNINRSKAEILFVCLGAPKQEKWIYEHRKKLEYVRFAAGLGGSLDVFAGTAQRAPEFYLKHNLEWLYRFSKNPSRVGRMLKLPKFLVGTVVHKNKPVQK